MNVIAKEDPRKKPEALPAKEFNFPKYETITLDNGLKVFIVNDDQQPTVNFRILLNGGSLADGNKSSVSDITTQMLIKGTAKYSALDIANKLDGLGLSLNVSSSADYCQVYGSGLKKHLQTLLEITNELLTAPTFPQDELDKLKSISIADVKQMKARSSSVAAAIGRIALYGSEHPYAKMASEETINSLQVNDLKQYFKSNFIPNNATMVITGDVSAKNIKKDLEKYFSNWKKGTKNEFAVPEIKPEPVGVYFVSRPGAVQSSINVVTQGVPRNHPDYDKLNFTSSIIGAGFAGRLFKTLRETYSYTYTPFGYITSTKFTNRFSCGADVRGDVTDSSIIVINDQLELLTKEMPSDAELNLLKKYEIGQYLMAFSSKDYSGMLIQNADFYGLNINDIKTQHLKIQKYTPIDMMTTAKKYMNPRGSYIVVVGDPKIKPSLEKFGKIYEYNTDYLPETGAKAKAEKIDLSANQLIDKYVNAIGGKDKINSINTIIATGKIDFSIQGQTLPGSVEEKTKAPNKKYSMMDLGMMQNVYWCNGTKAWMKVGNTTSEAEPDDFEKIKAQSTIMRDANLINLGYKVEVIGKQKDWIVAKVSKNKEELTYFYDAKTFLIVKKEWAEPMQDGMLPVTEIYSDYKDFGGVKFPTTVKLETAMYNYTQSLKYEINSPIDDADFTPKN